MQSEKQHKVLPNLSRVHILIGVNIVFFLILGIAGSTLSGHTVSQILVSYLALPASLPVLVTRFWTPFSHLFLYDGGFFNFIFGMLWFYWIGSVFEDYVGSKKLLYLYAFGGLSGAFLFILGHNLFPLFAASQGPVVSFGAPAAVMAVLVGTATLVPDYSVFMFIIGEVRLKWIIAVYVGVDLLFLMAAGGSEVFSHIGGAIIGFAYVRQLQNGSDWGERISRLFKRRTHLRVVSRNLKNTTAKPRQDEIDRILDKISSSGYDSLSKNEKDTLLRASDDKS